jgi:glycine dehydrogenase subunit 1
MRYLPQTREDIDKMLQVVGVGTLDGLFSGIPEDCRRKDDLNLPEPLTEWELNHRIDGMAGAMAVAPQYKVFMGAGSYHHYIPEVVKQLLSRSEVYTAYTPYQPEISQGTLQAIYEYQTLVSRLLGMEVANASMYDGEKKWPYPPQFIPCTVGSFKPILLPPDTKWWKFLFCQTAGPIFPGLTTWRSWPVWPCSLPIFLAASRI